MIHAIYRLREDGDYDFVMAVETDIMEQHPMNETVEEWLDRTVITAFREKGDEIKIVEEESVSDLPDVYDGDVS